jgi:hypothetical protein
VVCAGYAEIVAVSTGLGGIYRSY